MIDARFQLYENENRTKLSGEVLAESIKTKISQLSKRSNPIAALPAVEQEADREKKADEGDKLGKEGKSDKDGKSEMPATKDTVTAPPLGQTDTKTKEDSHKFEFEKQEMAKPNKLFDLYCGDSSPPRGQLVAPFTGAVNLFHWVQIISIKILRIILAHAKIQRILKRLEESIFTGICLFCTSQLASHLKTRFQK